MVTGQIEVVAYEWKLLNTSKTPPFAIEDRSDAGENLRLTWRYLDLRRPRMFRKSPFSLPPEQYGGARKRIFIGLMLASCFVLCALVAFFLVLPWAGLFETRHWLPMISITFGISVIIALLWLCILLVFYIYTGKYVPGVDSVRHVHSFCVRPFIVLALRFVALRSAQIFCSCDFWGQGRLVPRLS